MYAYTKKQLQQETTAINRYR